jgi:hypothetical protein
MGPGERIKNQLYLSRKGRCLDLPFLIREHDLEITTLTGTTLSLLPWILAGTILRVTIARAIRPQVRSGHDSRAVPVSPSRKYMVIATLRL